MFKKVGYFVLSTVLAFIPLELSIGVWMLLKPINFWEKTVLITAATILCGTLQCYLIIVWLLFIIALFSKKQKSLWSKENYEKEKKMSSFINRIKNY